MIAYLQRRVDDPDQYWLMDRQGVTIGKTETVEPGKRHLSWVGKLMYGGPVHGKVRVGSTVTRVKRGAS